MVRPLCRVPLFSDGTCHPIRLWDGLKLVGLGDTQNRTGGYPGGSAANKRRSLGWQGSDVSSLHWRVSPLFLKGNRWFS